jgi:hypothetical protein
MDVSLLPAGTQRAQATSMLAGGSSAQGIQPVAFCDSAALNYL